MDVPTSNPIANRRALTEAVQLVVRANRPTAAQMVAAASALSRVMTDEIGTKCELKLVVEPVK